MELWIARGFSGALCAYTVEPIYDNIIKNWIYDYENGTAFLLDHRMLPEVTFENSPQKVEIKFVKEGVTFLNHYYEE